MHTHTHTHVPRSQQVLHLPTQPVHDKYVCLSQGQTHLLVHWHTHTHTHTHILHRHSCKQQTDMKTYLSSVNIMLSKFAEQINSVCLAAPRFPSSRQCFHSHSGPICVRKYSKCSVFFLSQKHLVDFPFFSFSLLTNSWSCKWWQRACSTGFQQLWYIKSWLISKAIVLYIHGYVFSQPLLSYFYGSV